MLSETAKREIRALQDEDGWFHNGHEDFYELAEGLMARGLSEADAVEFLSGAYGAVANEFGA